MMLRALPILPLIGTVAICTLNLHIQSLFVCFQSPSLGLVAIKLDYSLNVSPTLLFLSLRQFLNHIVRYLVTRFFINLFQYSAWYVGRWGADDLMDA